MIELKYSVKLICLVVIRLRFMQTFESAAAEHQTLSPNKHVQYQVFNTTDHNSTTEIELLNLRSQQLNETLISAPNLQSVCAFMNVSHNSSYIIYDREEFSQGLEHIHNTVDIFEEFLNINVEHGCEATICELVLLDPVARSRKCYSFNGSRDFTKDADKAADPATHNYFVSTGCSCKDPKQGCNDIQCDNHQLLGNQCAKLYKETSCSECRYDAINLKEFDWFIPTNGFWCQSLVIRDGCRLSIDSVDANGAIISNFANYTGISRSIALNYVRKPTPPKFSCICDLEDANVTQRRKTWTISIAVSIIAILVIVISILVLRKCIRIRVEKKISRQQLDNLIRRFRNGFSSEETVSLNEYVQNDYVSTGHLNALIKPYEHQWEINRDRITLVKKIGIGEFGVVYLAELKDGLKKGSVFQVAGKVPKVKSISCFNSVLAEIKIWSYIGVHKNVCKFLGACTQDIPRQNIIIVLEYCSEKNLRDYLRKHKSTFLEPSLPEVNCIPGAKYVTLGGTSKDDRMKALGYVTQLQVSSTILLDKFRQLIKWAAEIASGMEFISSKQVVHIDLAARNIFLNELLECKIGDFGLSQRLHEIVDYVRVGDEYPIPYRWMALESLTNLKFTTYSDVWSYGITLFEMFSLGLDPYQKVSGFSDLIQMLQSGQRLEKPLYGSDDIYQVMLQCWDEEATERPNFEHLKRLFESMSVIT